MDVFRYGFPIPAKGHRDASRLSGRARSRPSRVRPLNVGLAATAAGLAVLGWLHLLNPYLILVSVFLIGVGFAFDAPAWTSIVPQVVSDAELPSAATLSGLQFNVSGIIGPMLGGFLVPLAGANFVFALNAACFLLVVQATHQWKPPVVPAKLPTESFFEFFQDGYPLYSLRARLSGRVGPKFPVCPIHFSDSGIDAGCGLSSSNLGLSFTSMDRWSARCSSFRGCELACGSLRQRWNTFPRWDVSLVL